jgi:deoxyribonuclease V
MKVENPGFIPRKGLDRGEMKSLQDEIADKAIFEDKIDLSPEDIDRKIVVGVDQAFLDDKVLGAAVVLKQGEIIERKYAVDNTPMPYIPGLLAFREGKSIVKALKAGKRT